MNSARKASSFVSQGARLAVGGLSVAYGRSAPALKGIDIEVEPGEMVAVLGSNGAGKTTLLRAITGLLDFHGGRIVDGSVTLDDRQIAGLSSSRIARLGVAQVPEGRRIFSTLSVEENLRINDRRVRRAQGSGMSVDRIYDTFPVLSQRRTKTAGLLSGGEQQMLALGRAFVARPRLLCIDELSLGLAPVIAKRAMAQVAELNAEYGVSVLLIEQNARLALKHAHRAYVLDVGRVALHGNSGELLAAPQLIQTYLGEAGT